MSTTLSLYVLCMLAAVAPPEEHPTGKAVIRGKAGKGEIVITTTPRVAGAIHSLRWHDHEFIDSFDHGRQLQSAASFDTPGGNAEVFNPTEAGSQADGRGEKSTSRLLAMKVGPAELQTTTQMAFWLAPGEKSHRDVARNTQVLSDYLVSKHVRIGYQGLQHAIEYEVTFHLPPGVRHTYAQFEALTGYMPAEFNHYYTFDPKKGELKPLDDGPGEQALPIVFSDRNGRYAMGIYSPDQPSPGFEKAGYGRFCFPSEKVNKWNCVFRVRDAHGIATGDYRYRLFVLVGTRRDVTDTMTALYRSLTKP